MKKPTREMLVQFLEQHEPRSHDDVMEIMREIYARMPWGQPIALSNGKTFFLKKFIEPQFKAQSGTYEFGFEAKYADDSGHIEFNVSKCGWGFRVLDDDA